MERVHVARKAVEESLLGQRLRRDRLVRLPVGRDVPRAARAAVAAEAALAACEDARGVAEEEAALLVYALGLDDDQRGLRLVVDRLDGRRGRDRAARRDRRV